MGRKRRRGDKKANSMKIKTKACSVKLQRITVTNTVIKEEPHDEENENIVECVSSLINTVKDERFPDGDDCIMEERLTITHTVIKEERDYSDNGEHDEYNEDDKQVVEPQHTTDEVNNMGEHNRGQYSIQTSEYSSVHHKYPSKSQTSRKMRPWHNNNRHYPPVYNHLWHNNNRRYPPAYSHPWHNNNRRYPPAYDHPWHNNNRRYPPEHLWYNNNRCYPPVYNHQFCFGLYQCDICSQEFYEFSTLLRHKLVHDCLDILRDALNTLKIYRCNICGIDVIETDVLIKHYWDHLQQYIFYDVSNGYFP